MSEVGVVARGLVGEEEAGCSCRDWSTLERRRKASMRVDVYSLMAGSSNT